MPMPPSTLAAIQSAGAAIYAADVAMKASVQDHAEQVKVAMLQNPFDMGNDGLFEDWKTLARLSQAILQIEAEFKKIYNAACDVSVGSRSGVAVMPTLAANRASAPGDLEVVKEIQATDAVIKSVAGKARRVVASKGTPRPLKGNAHTLMAYLEKILSTTQFARVNRMAVAEETGLAKGSIGAAFAKLVQTGYLVEGPSGTFKLSASNAY